MQLQIRIGWKDTEPKLGLTVNNVAPMIGDGYPLCVKLPPRPFLRKGALYRYRGPNPLPALQTDRTEFGDDFMSDGSTVERFELEPATSKLYKALCGADAEESGTGPSAGSGGCQFKSQVTLTENLECDGMECRVDTARTVKLNATENGVPYSVYYEYVRPPCVELSYFRDPKTVPSRGGENWASVSRMGISFSRPIDCTF